MPAFLRYLPLLIFWRASLTCLFCLFSLCMPAYPTSTVFCLPANYYFVPCPPLGCKRHQHSAPEGIHPGGAWLYVLLSKLSEGLYLGSGFKNKTVQSWVTIVFLTWEWGLSPNLYWLEKRQENGIVLATKMYMYKMYNVRIPFVIKLTRIRPLTVSRVENRQDRDRTLIYHYMALFA